MRDRLGHRAPFSALEAWYADHDTYTGATLPTLRERYDATLPDGLIVVDADTRSYCVELIEDDGVLHRAGPDAEILRGSCP